MRAAGDSPEIPTVASPPPHRFDDPGDIPVTTDDTPPSPEPVASATA
jgi:hypothetical protein